MESLIPTPAVAIAPLYAVPHDSLTMFDLAFIPDGATVPDGAVRLKTTADLAQLDPSWSFGDGSRSIEIHVFSNPRDAAFFEDGAEWADPGFFTETYTDPASGATFLVIVLRDPEQDEIIVMDHRGPKVAVEVTRDDADMEAGWLQAAAAHIEDAHEANPTWDQDPSATADAVQAVRNVAKKLRDAAHKA